MADKASEVLPPEFSALERHVSGWGQASSNARHHHRQTSSMTEIREFYDDLQPRLEAIFSYLDQFDVRSLPEPAKHLVYLSFGFIEAALAVEVFNTPGVPGVPYPRGFFSITRELL